jgi:hypothetical protein
VHIRQPKKSIIEKPKCIKMKRKCFSLAVMFMTLVFFFSGCATIVSTSKYDVPITSTPSDAAISITNKKGIEVYTGKTPATVTLRSGAGYFSKAEYQVRFSSPGYDDKVATIQFWLNEWYFGNLLLGGVIGMLIVDPLTGAMWKLMTPLLNVTLSKTTTSTGPEMKIMCIDQVPESWKAHLVRIN